MPQYELTKLLDCAEGLVSRWISGERIPMARYAAQLEAQLEIPARWWGEDAPVDEPPPSARRPSVAVPASEPASEAAVDPTPTVPGGFGVADRTGTEG